MHSLYNRVAGQSVERLAALSDGIFAVAMTLLVLDLRVPASEAVHAESDLWRILVALSPRLVVFLMSLMTLGIFWVGQQTQLNLFARGNRNLTWIHIGFLLLELELLHSGAPSRRRCSGGSSSGGHSPHCDRAVVVRLRRRAVLFQHVLQHRRNRDGAGELRDCPEVLLGIIFAEVNGRIRSEE